MNQGHGHVFPREDGVKARCGGPALCTECAWDKAHEDAKLFGVGWLQVDHEGRLRYIPPERIQVLP